MANRQKKKGKQNGSWLLPTLKLTTTGKKHTSKKLGVFSLFFLPRGFIQTDLDTLVLQTQTTLF
jgi:hypothetical protein